MLFAGHTPGNATDTATVVVLRDLDQAGNTTLAFLSSLYAPAGTAPDPTNLRVRAQMTVPGTALTAPAYGFVASAPVPGDPVPPAPVSRAVAIVAPGVSTAQFSTSAVDAEMSDSANAVADGMIAVTLPPQAGGWNTQIVTGTGKSPEVAALGSGVTDPATTSVTVNPASPDGLATFTGSGARLGDVVTVQDGVLGVVTAVSGDSGTLDTHLARIPAAAGGRAETAVTALPVTLAQIGGGVVVTAGPDVLREGNRIVLRGADAAASVNNLATVVPGADGTWMLQRSAALPTTAISAILIHH